MDFKNLFNSEKPFQKIKLPPGSSRKNIPKDMSFIESEFAKPIHARKIANAGYEYVSQYVKEEERKILEASDNTVRANNYETVSVGTASTMTELNGPDLTAIYQTYDFAYRPKHNLTINSVQEKIVSMIETNPVLVIQGPTGCGKTTQVPQFILDYSYRKKEHCNIIVTQPRRIAAISIAKRVSEERSWPLGTLVGYRVGMVNNTSEDTRLTYCTTGVLLRKLINSKHMMDFTHIILDEVHERDQDMDFLLLVVRKFLWSNSRTVKVILMSATINVDKFSKYFSSPVANCLTPAPIVDVVKKSCYEVNKYYLCQLEGLGTIPEIKFDEPKITDKMMEFCARLLVIFDDIDKKDYINNGYIGDDYNRNVVLIFLPGIWEIEEMHNILMSPKYENIKWDIVVLHSTITNEEQQRIFEQHAKDYRRVILSTNIAESSITVPNVKYVIDFCLTKILITDPITNFQCLELSWASKANCDQRAGRTGRVMDGRVYRLVPKFVYERQFPDEGAPEILRAPLEHLVLNAKLLDMGEPKAILALSLDPPNLANLENTILLLKEVGALLNTVDNLNPFDGDLTSLGKIMASLPVEIHIAKLIALGHAFGVLRSTIIIGASMSTKSMFNNPFQKKLEAYNAKLRWSNGSWSDLTTNLQAYQVWLMEKTNRHINSKQSEKNWALRHFIQLKVLYEIQAMVTDLTVRLKNVGIIVPMGHDKDRSTHADLDHALILKVVIAGSFYPNYFISRTSEQEDNELSNVKILGGLDPLTTVYLQGWPIKQPGVLYARRFQETFNECTTDSSRKIRVTFDGSSRVYITFPQSNYARLLRIASNDPNAEASVPGRVPTAVYKALKMRKTNMPISIPVINDVVANKIIEDMGMDQKPYNLLFFAEKQTKALRTMNIRPFLPALDVSYIPIVVQNVIDPGHFWVTLNDEDTNHKLIMIETCANNFTLTQPISKKPAIGALILAPYRMNGLLKYYRALVENYFIVQNEQTARLLLIDYGFKTEARVSDLRDFKDPKRFSDISALAFECVLANIKPSILRDISGQWTPDAFRELHNLLFKQTKLFGEVYSVVNSVVSLIVYCMNGKNKFSINEYLINKGYAVYKVEGYLSRKNHNVRENYTDLSTEQRNFYEESQYDQDYLTQMYPTAPPTLDCYKKISLRGPFSPLEIELMHLVTAGEGKKVNIDSTSVNSILLDPNPEESEQIFVVAGNVSQNIARTQLCLRNTTLMPNVQGLTSLMSLIFTPRMELKRNELGNRYAGALCGLGCHPLTKESIFPEHDMEVKFDIEITNDDLVAINKLRHWMCLALQLPEEDRDNVEQINVLQTHCRETLLKIVEKKRNPQKIERVLNHGKWGTYDSSLIMYPGLHGMLVNNIYPLHNAMVLENISPDYEKMMNHLENLKIAAIEDPRKLNQDILCELCQEKVFGVYNLRIHLCSQMHKENEEKLQQDNAANLLH